MYAALWRMLPGAVWLRIVILVVFGCAVLFALATWIFPWIDGMLNSPAGTVNR